MITLLTPRDIDEILALQYICFANNDLFIPTSREGYLRAFRFQNFCLGYRETLDSPLTAFLNCSIPTERSQCNWGRGRLPDGLLNAVGHINTLLIQVGRRRRGLGRDMVDAALARFSREKCSHIYATVSPDNRASLKLLNSFGFSVVDTIWLHGQQRHLVYGQFS